MTPLPKILEESLDYSPTDYSRAISFNVGLAREMDINTAIVYNELVFWSDKGGRNDGWIYKSYDEMMLRLPLSKFQLSNAYKRLADNEYIEYKLMKANGAPTLHFRLLRNFTMESKQTSQSIDSKETSQSLTVSNQKSNNNNAALDAQLDELALILKVQKPRNYALYRGPLRNRLVTYTINEVKSAAAALVQNEYMMGKNDSHKRYATLEYLVRSDRSIEKWMTNEARKPAYL